MRETWRLALAIAVLVIVGAMALAPRVGERPCVAIGGTWLLGCAGGTR